jgi:hypothetical protein
MHIVGNYQHGKASGFRVVRIPRARF